MFTDKRMRLTRASEHEARGSAGRRESEEMKRRRREVVDNMGEGRKRRVMVKRAETAGWGRGTRTGALRLQCIQYLSDSDHMT